MQLLRRASPEGCDKLLDFWSSESREVVRRLSSRQSEGVDILSEDRHHFLDRNSILLLLLAVLLGLLGGLGAFTFGYGDGAAYLSSDPVACKNCHIMEDQFDSWLKSSHQRVAVCNDCHLPPGAVGKWVTKADNGFFHSLAFTLENFHEPIQIKPRNRRVTQSACIACHQDFVHQMLPVEPSGDMELCVKCHADAGHAAR